MPSATTDRFNTAPGEGAKVPCRMATTANITLEGLQTIDGVIGAVEDRVLVKDQTDSTENGIYTMQSTEWVRTADWDDNTDAKPGVLIPVGDEGTANRNTVWLAIFTGTLTIGTTDVTFGRSGLAPGDTAKAYLTIAEALADTSVSVALGQIFTVADYATGNNSGTLFFKWVASGTGTPDGGSYIDHDTLPLQAEQNFPAVLSVKMFGATGNGVTDDYTAIQSALSFNRASVLAPKGSYKTSAQISVPADTILYGAGTQTIFSPSVNMDSVFIMSAGINSTVRDFQISNPDTVTANGIIIQQGLCNVIGCYITGMVNGVVIDGGDNLKIEVRNNTMLSCDFGVFIVDDGRNTIISNNHMQGGTGIWMTYTTQQPEGVRITDNNILPSITANPNTGYGIVIDGALEIELAGNIVDNVDKTGLYLPNNLDTKYIKVIGNWFGAEAAVSGSKGFESVGAASHVVLSGNTFTGAESIGINVDYISGGVPNSYSITDNLCFGNAVDLRADNLSNGIIKGNHFNSAISSIEQDNNSDCIFTENVYTNAPTAVSTASSYRFNRGAYITESDGDATIVSGSTSVTVNHGLSVTPSARDISVFPEFGTSNDFGFIWIDAFTPTQFRINVRFDPGASGVFLRWQAQVL